MWSSRFGGYSIQPCYFAGLVDRVGLTSRRCRGEGRDYTITRKCSSASDITRMVVLLEYSRVSSGGVYQSQSQWFVIERFKDALMFLRKARSWAWTEICWGAGKRAQSVRGLCMVRRLYIGARVGVCEPLSGGLP